MKTFARFALVALLVPVACGGDDANVAGSYTMAVTNGANGCAINNWTVGMQTIGIPVVVRQEGSNVTAEVMGLAGLGVAALLGTNVFVGDVDGDSIDLDVTGMTKHDEGGCSYTFNANLRGSLDGDALAGEVLYRAATNGHPDCAPYEGCISVQKYAGTRPP